GRLGRDSSVACAHTWRATRPRLIAGIGPYDRLQVPGLGQRDWSIEVGRQVLVADAGQPEVGDLERARFGDEQGARLDIPMAPQPLADRVLHAQAELDAVPKRSRRVDRLVPDPAPQLATGYPFEHDVRLPVDLLDRKRLDDVRVPSQPDPEPALRSK